MDGDHSPEDAAQSNEALSTEAINDSQSGAAEKTHQLDAAVSTSRSTSPGSEVGELVNEPSSALNLPHLALKLIIQLIIHNLVLLKKPTGFRC
jgi:hypothetical protein